MKNPKKRLNNEFNNVNTRTLPDGQNISPGCVPARRENNVRTTDCLVGFQLAIIVVKESSYSVLMFVVQSS